MNEKNDTKLRDLLREAFRPPANAGLERDLWPRMLRKLDQGCAQRSWLDWILAALAGAWILVFPQAIPSLLYHL
jgi:anti-sigma factor RsiW